MAIVRRYSPPFQAPAPKPGADDIGRAVKGLVSVELQRTSEISFAVESFGCDGKKVLSLLRDLPCETTGRLVVAGTKNGMPFSLNSDLPRGLDSAIRGSGGSMRTVASGAAFRTTETVLYDNFGNYWALSGETAIYRGETPPLYSGDGVTPALCVQVPRIRPYELRWEYIQSGGDPEVNQAAYLRAGCGWQGDSDPSPLIAFPVAYPYVPPSDYWRIEQWIPDQTTPPTGGEYAAAWPTSKRRVDVLWYPGRSDTPHDWDSVTENSIDVIVSKYLTDPPWRVLMNWSTRPLLEHISTGGLNDEIGLVICVEKDLVNSPFNSRIAMRGRSTGTLAPGYETVSLPVSGRVMFTPDVTEGWLMQTGVVTAEACSLRRFRSRASSTDAYGSALTELDALTVTLPAAHAHDWTEPVWFRVGRVTQYFGTNPLLTPRLPLWG